ncbi:uncharacterized protein METZ01_LOCUS509660, partial [marine metagenome]
MIKFTIIMFFTFLSNLILANEITVIELHNQSLDQLLNNSINNNEENNSINNNEENNSINNNEE